MSTCTDTHLHICICIYANTHMPIFYMLIFILILSYFNTKGRILYKLQFAFILLVVDLGTSFCICTLKISPLLFLSFFLFFYSSIMFPGHPY